MNKRMLVVMTIALLSIPLNAWAQLPKQGFFVGGGLAALQMNGVGTIGDENEEFDVTNDIVRIISEGDEFFLDGLNGWSFNDKILFGVQPLVGYKFSPHFTIMGTYNFYFQKNGETDDQVIAGRTRISVEGKAEYSQRAIQILGQLGKQAFLVAGIEFVSLQTAMNISSGTFEMKIEGDDQVKGFVLGAGVELPSASQTMSFVATAMYSFTKYKGDKLLVDALSDQGIGFELGVGGLSGSLGIRVFFK